MKTPIAILTIILLLMPTLVLAEEPATDPITKLINHVTQEHIKTRTEATKYADAKFSQYDEKIQTEIKPFIDENFKILDDRLHALATQVILQISLAIFLSIIMANVIWYIIKRQIDNLRTRKNNRLHKDTLTANTYGQITPEYQKILDKEDQTIIKKPILKETEIKPTSPSIEQIQTMLEQKKEKEELAKKDEHQNQITERPTKKPRKQRTPKPIPEPPTPPPTLLKQPTNELQQTEVNL